MADADTPDLGIGVAGQQASGGRQSIVRYLEGFTVDVKSHDPTVIAGLHLGAHLLLVKSHATAGMLFFTVPRLGFHQGLSLIWQRRFIPNPIVAAGRHARFAPPGLQPFGRDQALTQFAQPNGTNHQPFGAPRAVER
jgi:hypothetical protein